MDRANQSPTSSPTTSGLTNGLTPDNSGFRLPQAPVPTARVAGGQAIADLPSGGGYMSPPVWPAGGQNTLVSPYTSGLSQAGFGSAGMRK